MKFIKIDDKRTQVNAGAMNRFISLYQRDIQPPSFNEEGIFDFDEQFTLLKQVWANLDVKSGEQIFDEVNVIQQETHIFRFRWLVEFPVTFEIWIRYRGYAYKVFNVRNYEEKYQFYELMAVKRGVDTLAATYA